MRCVGYYMIKYRITVNHLFSPLADNVDQDDDDDDEDGLLLTDSEDGDEGF